MLPDRGHGGVARRHIIFALCACFLSRDVDGLAVGAVGTLPRCGTAIASASRSKAATMLEAFDLLPVVDCLKQDNMDAVQGCMDQLEPWLELTEGGGLSFSLNAVNGFIGGTVGVLGTVGATLVKKAEVKDRLKCVYCEGSGQILCGHCFGTKKLSYIKEDKTVVLGEDCANCETTGSVVCINCQGSGLSVPDDFLQVLGDEEVGFTEEDYIGLFDETPIPRGNTPSVNLKKGPAPAKKPPAKVGTSSGGDEQPTDYTGGMG